MTDFAAVPGVAAPTASPAPVYPAHLIEFLELEGGRGVTLRPVMAGDADGFQVFVESLGSDTRYRRFFTGVSRLPPALARRMTDVDYTKHLCFIATAEVYGRERIVGEARYVVEGDGGAADFAIAVHDDWQTSGIGSRMLRVLEGAARGAGLKRLTGDVLAGNRKALDFMRQRGFQVLANRGDARLVRVEKLL